MAAAATITRFTIISNSTRRFILNRLLSPSITPTPPFSHPKTPPKPTLFSLPRSFCTTTTTNNHSTPAKRNTLVNYSLSDSDEEEEDDDDDTKSKTSTKKIDKSTPPPPYDPFNKKPVIEEPDDPTNLQEVFHRIRSGGLFNDAVKMFDGLSKEGLTHEALELFGQITDKGQMPEVVAHTAVMEAYVNAGQFKDAHKVYLRMLASGVLPNVYSYGVLIKGLVGSGDEKLVKEAKKCVEEMVRRGMKPNAAVCVGVYEGLVKAGKVEEGREVLEMVKSKELVPDEGKVREVLKGKRGEVYRGVLSVLYGK